MPLELIRSMPEKLLKIDHKEGVSPYNTRLTLDLSMLKEIMPLIQPEILKGLVDSSGDNNVILHVNLTDDKILLLSRLLRSKPERKIA